MRTQDPLQDLKDRALSYIRPYWNRVSSQDFDDLQKHLDNCATAMEVQGYYKAWQLKLHYKNIANLPDLTKKQPRKTP